MTARLRGQVLGSSNEWANGMMLPAVGFGDVVMSSVLGKAVVLGMICVGVVLIPVQTSQLYSQLTARRVALGEPGWDSGA